MLEQLPSSRMIRFGVFEVDLAAGELRKGGVKIKLQDQPFRVLVALLARPGEVVTREELREKLWRDGTFVDFDRGVNTAINKIREALGDSASHPRFVETLPRRGYRFVGPVEGAGQRPTDGTPDSTGATLAQESVSAGGIRPLQSGVAAAKSAVLAKGPAGSRRGLYRGLAALVVVLILGTLYWMGPWESEAEPSRTTLKIVPVTSYVGLERKPAISSDGDQVAFSWNGVNQDNHDIYVQLVGAGRPLRLTSDPAEDTSPAWSPDGRHIAFQRRFSATTWAVMTVPALGGSERKLTEAFAAGEIGTVPEAVGDRALSWSPDGKFLAIVDRAPEDQTTGCIFSLSVETGEKRRLTSPPLGSNRDYSPAFSPDGRWLAFARGGPDGDVYALSLADDGGPEGEPRQLTFTGGVLGLDWSADGRSIVFSADRAGSLALWRVSVSGGEPERLAVGDSAIYPSISQQGNRLVYEQLQLDTNIWRTPGISADGPRAATRFIASTRGDFSPHFSRDGSKIVFESTRSGSRQIWISDADGLNPVQLTSFEGPHRGMSPRWSPDGRWVVFNLNPGEVGTFHVNVVSAEGGAPRQLTSGPYREVRASWSRDSRWIYFGSNRGGDWQVWKVPFEGGEPLQVTRGGGREAMESPDGAFIYYSKQNPIRGVWRVAVNGGDEEQVFDQGRQGRWEITGEGIYFLNQDAQPSPAIEFFRFSTRRVERLVTLAEGTRFADPRRISVSADGRWVLFSREEHLQSDIMLVEDFR